MLKKSVLWCLKIGLKIDKIVKKRQKGGSKFKGQKGGGVHIYQGVEKSLKKARLLTVDFANVHKKGF